MTIALNLSARTISNDTVLTGGVGEASIVMDQRGRANVLNLLSCTATSNHSAVRTGPLSVMGRRKLDHSVGKGRRLTELFWIYEIHLWSQQSLKYKTWLTESDGGILIAKGRECHTVIIVLNLQNNRVFHKRTKFSWFHAVFGKIWQKSYVGAPPGGSATPPSGNPGSALLCITIFAVSFFICSKWV